jgi:alkyl sulfatase-like protein
MEQIIYGKPEFTVRNIWRLEGGWHYGMPSHLKPASEAAQAREIVDLAGGVGRIVERALAKFEAHEFALASHLIDLAVAAALDDKTAHEARMKIYAARALDSRSTMAHGIFRTAGRRIPAKAGITPPADPPQGFRHRLSFENGPRVVQNYPIFAERIKNMKMSQFAVAPGDSIRCVTGPTKHRYMNSFPLIISLVI